MSTRQERSRPVPSSGGPRPVDPTAVKRRLAAIVLAFEAPVIGLGALAAWGIFGARGDAVATTYLWVGLGLAAVCVLAAGLLRRPVGFALGWLVQVATLLSAFLLPPMLLVGLVFGGLWAVAIVQGRKMDALTARYVQRNPPTD